MKDDLTFRVPMVGTGRKLSYAEYDATINRLLYAQGQWNAGEQYTPNELVYWQGGLWYCIANSTVGLEPGHDGGAEWVLYSPNPGRGGASASGAVFSDIGLGWTTLPLAVEDITAVGCSFDLAADTFAIDWWGLWHLDIAVFFEHNSSNQGRTTQVRIYNVTDGAGSTGVTLGTGRNAEATQFAAKVPFVVNAANADDILRLEIGGGDDYVVTQITVGVDLTQITPSTA